MSLKKDSLVKLLLKNKLVATEAEALELIDAKEEKDLTIDDSLSIFTKEELSTRDKNKYNDAKAAAEEMLAGSLIDEHKLTAKKKDMKSVLDAFKQQVLEGANVKVDEQVRQKDLQVKALQDSILAKDQELSTWQTKTKEAESNSKYIQLLPRNRDNRFTDAQWVNLIKGKYAFMDLDGKEVIKDLETGEVVRDPKLSNPLLPADVFKNHFESQKWVKSEEPTTVVTTGRGGSTTTVKTGGGKPSNIKEFREYAMSQGGLQEHELNGNKGRELLRQIVKENPQFSFEVSK